MIKKGSQFISVIFHPILMPAAGVALILTLTHLSLIPSEGKIAIYKIVGLSTVLLPLSMIPLLYFQKQITSLTMPERKERLIPLFTSVLFYYAGYFILARLNAPAYICYFILSAFIALTVTLVIHFKWKISTHMVGIGGIIGLLTTFEYLYKIDITYWLIAAILVAGLTGTSRLYLKAHRPAQIYGGFILGFISTFIVVTGMTLF